MAEKKIVKRSVAVALGIACIVLIAGMGGVVAYYTIQISNRDNQIASGTETINELNATIANQNNAIALLNAKITNLTDEENQLQTWLNETITLLNQTQTPPMAEGNANGLQLTMTLEKQVYSLEEPINITLTLTNISNQTTTFVLGDNNGYNFQVYNGTNSTVYSSSWVPPGQITLPLEIEETINAGQGMSWYLSWQQDGSSGYVLPGTYYIVGQFGSVINDKTNVTIETTPIQIAILPF